MKIVLLTHPEFSDSKSMPRFASYIAEGMRARGHEVVILTPKAIFTKLAFGRGVQKLFGYIDSLIIFPLMLAVRSRLWRDRLFVLTDQALCPWMACLDPKKTVVHVHDFIALKSALGLLPGVAVSWTGRLYQKIIRRGVRAAENFVPVSGQTHAELIDLIRPSAVNICEVVYNGLNYDFRPVKDALDVSEEARYLLHVGGNSWYKNRVGVVQIYSALCEIMSKPPGLVLAGAQPNGELLEFIDRVPRNGSIVIVENPPNEEVRRLYSNAAMLLFPSREEGFGWPIIEAMACGCPVITTDKPPMSEIGGDAALYFPVPSASDQMAWAMRCAKIIQVSMSPKTLDMMSSLGLRRAGLFSASAALEGYERIYLDVLRRSGPACGRAVNYRSVE